MITSKCQGLALQTVFKEHRVLLLFTWENCPSIGFDLVFNLARTCLLILLIVCMDSVFLLEQPSSSLMVLFHRMRQTFRMLKAVGVKVGLDQKEKTKTCSML